MFGARPGPIGRTLTAARIVRLPPTMAGSVKYYLRVRTTPADFNTAALTPTVRHAEYEMPFRSP